MDAETILVLGVALLGFGSVSMFLVRRSNTRLRGLGWLGAAFAAGAAGAGLLVAPHLPHAVAALLPDVLTLGAFVFLQVSFSELLGVPLLPRLGLSLLAGMAAMDVLYTTHLVHGSVRVSAICLFVALECTFTGRELWGRRHVSRAADFCAIVLFAFSGLNLVRAALVATRLDHRWGISSTLLVLSFATFIAVGLGLAFGIFWMSNARLATSLEELASIDPLTRIYNRRTFLRACENELGVSLRKTRPFSILIADLDHFKGINDQFGHEAGDEALLAAVESMQNSIRGIDTLGRWGGEEFVVLLPNASEDAARIVAERMRANVQGLELLLGPEKRALKTVVRMTISIGLATFRPHDDLQTLLRRADQCLYQAKGAGRNCVLQAG